MGGSAGRIVIVDYHKGNLSSVERGISDAGGEALVSDDPAVIRGAAGVVLPGVGSFGDAMAFLRESGEAEALLAVLERGVPFLGICLGLQLLFERGNETDDGSWAEGLGVLAGSATRLESDRLKVPHVGWDQVHLTDHGRACPLFRGVPEGANAFCSVGKEKRGTVQMQLFAVVDASEDRFVEVGFRSHGCLAAIACATAIAMLLRGKTIAEALEIAREDITALTGELPESRAYTYIFALEAIRALVGNYCLKQKGYSIADLDAFAPCQKLSVPCMLTENCSLRDDRVEQELKERGELKG